MRPAAAVAGGPTVSAIGPLPSFPMRTSVPNSPSFRASSTSVSPAGEMPRVSAPSEPIAAPAEPLSDPTLDELRVKAVLAAEHGMQVGQPTVTALLETRAAEQAEAEAAAEAAELAASTIAAPAPGTATHDPTPAILRILRGDHRALLATVEALAGEDEAMRRPWQAAVTGLAESIIDRAIGRGILDFPIGNPFWDTFTTEQCRTIAAALASTGHRFDGIDGWADGRIPGYRDLSAAVAAAGLEPRRIRHWPTQEAIALLYREVTVAADEDLAAQSPNLDLDEVQELAGRRAFELTLLWDTWEAAQRVLLGPVADA
jgi:hypothetical protein